MQFSRSLMLHIHAGSCQPNNMSRSDNSKKKELSVILGNKLPLISLKRSFISSMDSFLEIDRWLWIHDTPPLRIPISPEKISRRKASSTIHSKRSCLVSFFWFADFVGLIFAPGFHYRSTIYTEIIINLLIYIEIVAYPNVMFFNLFYCSYYHLVTIDLWNSVLKHRQNFCPYAVIFNGTKMFGNTFVIFSTSSIFHRKILWRCFSRSAALYRSIACYFLLHTAELSFSHTHIVHQEVRGLDVQ